MDTVCLKPLDEVVYKYSYFASLEPPSTAYDSPITNGGTIGAAINHPITKRVL